MNLSRRACLSALAAAGLLPAAGVAVGAAGATAATPSSPRALVLQAIRDAWTLRSVHLVQTTTGLGRGTSVLDVGEGYGLQNTRLPDGAVGHIRLIGETAYLSANPKGFRQIDGFTSRLSSQIGRHWASLRYPTKGFVYFAEGVTTASALNLSIPSGKLTELAQTTIDGQSVIPIQGGPPKVFHSRGTMILYLNTTDRPLPVAVTYRYPKSTTRQTFSRWAERFSVPRPTDVVTLSGPKI